MKKKPFSWRQIIIAIFLCCNFLSGLALARSLDEINNLGVLRVAADGMSPPFNYYKENQLVGFEVELAEEIAKRLGLKVEWIVQPFNTLLMAIKQDRFDLIATSHTITPARAKIVDFITPHYCTGAYIISKPGGPVKISELNGKRVSVAIGTVYFNKLAKIPNIKKILTVPSETEGLMALLAERADAWVTQRVIAVNAFKALPDQIHFQVGEPVLQQTNAMVVAKGNSELQELINVEFQKIMADGTYKVLMEHHVEEDIYCK